MSWAAVAAAGVGVAGSALSGAFSSKKPQTDNSTYEARAGALGQQNRLFDAFYGSNWRGGLQGDSGEWDAAKHGDYSKASQFRYGSAPGAGASPYNASSLYGGTTPFGTAPILQQIQGAAGKGLSADQMYQNDWTRQSNAINRAAQKYGTGQEAVIRGDSALSLKNAQAQIAARMAAAGLGGSTVEAGALGSASADNLREQERALADQAQRATGFKVNTAQQQQGAGAALYNTLAERANQYRMAPINSQLAVLNSGVANPWSGAPVGGASNPGLSPTQAGLGSAFGNLGALGGINYASQLYGQYGNQGPTPVYGTPYITSGQYQAVGPPVPDA